MNTSPLRALWLDDELDGSRRGYVEPWINWFQNDAKKLGVDVSMDASLAGFRSRVERNTQAGERIDLLILDVMLKREPARDFAVLGFPNERLLIMDAGVQIAGLLLNDEFADKRRGLRWLDALDDAYIVLLTSTTVVAELARQMVDPNTGRLASLTKSMDLTAGRATVSHEFDRTMTELIRRLHMRRDDEAQAGRTQ